MSTFIRLAVLSGLALTTFVRPASACSCAMRPVCAAFWEADRVFTGRAEVTALGPGAQRTRFRVEESFRGPANAVVEITARGIGGSCAYAFVHGTRYLVFAHHAPDGTWTSFFCDPTAPLDQADEGLAFARGVARDPRRGGQLAGSVLVAERARNGQLAPVVPLGGATITLGREASVFSANTDSNGQFQFTNLAPGRYTLTVSASHGVEPIAPATIEIKGPGACAVHVVMAVKRAPG